MSIDTNERLVPSLAEADSNEFLAMESALVREREWHSDADRYQTLADVETAIDDGKLKQLHASLDLRPLPRFQANLEGFVPFLAEPTWRAAHDFGDIWRSILMDESRLCTGGIRLAITSMVRSQDYQDMLVSGGRLASPGSTHCLGYAFDVDASGYYFQQSQGDYLSCVDPRRAHAGQEISKQIAKKLGQEYDPRTQGNFYYSQVTEAAIVASRRMHEDGAINLVEEFAGTQNACLHIAVNPEY